MMTVFRWDASVRTGGRAAASELPAAASEVAGENVLWINLADPTPDEEHDVLERFFQLHPLTVEDITKARREPEVGAHLPKVEEFPDYLFAVVNPLPPGLAEVVVKPKAKRDPAAGPPVPSPSDRLR